MNKKKIMALIMLASSMGTMPLMASSTATLQGDVGVVIVPGSGGVVTEWQDIYNAPKVHVVIKDAYKRAGKKERVVIELQDASWYGGTGTIATPMNLKGIEKGDFAIAGRNEKCVEYGIDIPSGIKEGETIEFDIPAVVTVMGNTPRVVIKPGDDTELIDESSVLLGSTDQLSVRYEVQQVPEIIDKGTLAPITFSELRLGAFQKETEVRLIIQNSNLAFGDITDYTSRTENPDDVDYLLDGSKYLKYSEGYTNEDETKATLKLKTYRKDNKEILVRLTGLSASEKGSILLKNIPIVTVGEAKEEDVSVKIQGDKLYDADKNIVLGHMILTAKEEPKQEEVKPEEVKQEEPEYGAKFKVGEKAYWVDEEKHDMDAAPFIQAPGYMMVPVRYVALAFGVDKQDLLMMGNTVYFKYNDRKVQLTQDSNIAYVNNSPVSMQMKVVNVNGRLYAPIGEVAKLMGLMKKWDAETQTVIFDRYIY